MQYGPKIVTNGLVLALDAAEANSYGPIKAEVLVVAGGGGGGGGHGAAGGGGAGGLVYHSAKEITPGSTITVTVGNGGQGGRYYGGSTTGSYGASNNSHGFQGGNSSFGDIIAIGGGGGNEAFYTDSIYKNGGSGGGAGDYYFGVANPGASRGGLATQTNSGGGIGYGFPGGSRGPGGPTTAEDSSHATPHEGSGGGGAGGTATGGGPSQPSDGGIGRYYPQFINAGSPAGWFAGGGGGGYYYYGPFTSTNAPNTETGWKGGGGRGCNGNTNYEAQDGGAYARGRGTTAGTPNTGGGGGGGSGNNTTPNAPDGGSGIVIIRYKGPQKATGGTITTVDNETVHTFTSSGSFVAGTNFADLSGNNITCTLTGSPVFNSANNGSIVFNGSTQFSTFTPTPTILQGNPNFTVIGFYKRTASFSSKGFWGIGGSNAGGTRQGICNWNYNNTNEITIDSWGESTFTTGQTYPLNTWIGVAWRKIAGPTTRANCIISIFDGTNITHYTSTALTVLRAESATNLNINSIGGITLGSISVDTGYCSPVNIANHCIYNRLLSDAEILLNFQATKTRFGL